MNKFQLSDAYAALVKAYDLKATQRDNLDRSDAYAEIMQLVHDGKWATVDVKMQENSYFNSDRPNDDDPHFELVG